MTTTLLIDETRAHEIFAELVTTHRDLRAHIEQAGLPARDWTEKYFDLDNELSGAIARVEALISQGAKVESSIPELTSKLVINYENHPTQVGRPAMSLADKLQRISELEKEMHSTTDYTRKAAIGKVIRRIRRSIVTAPALAAQMTPESFYEANKE